MRKKLIGIFITLLFVMSNVCLVSTAKNIEQSIVEYDITIEGGFGLTITIIYDKNIIDDLDLSFVLEGIILLSIPRTYNISISEDYEKVVIRDFLIGFGPLTVCILIDGVVEKEAEGLIVGCFVFLKNKDHFVL
jgi:hypothetical protein